MQELQAAKEAKKTERLDADVFDLINDTEEDLSYKAQPPQALSRVALGKRPLGNIRDAPLIDLRGEDEEV